MTTSTPRAPLTIRCADRRPVVAPLHGTRRVWLGTSILLAALAQILGSCSTPADYRREADAATYQIIDTARQSLLGHSEPFTIETPADTLRRRLLLDQVLPHSDPSSLGSHDVSRIEQWPDDSYFEPQSAQPAVPWSTTGTLKLALLDALQIGARNSREYQLQKELVFQAGLALDLERDHFGLTWAGLLNGELERDLSADPNTTSAFGSGSLGVAKRFENGIFMTLNLAFDLVKLLTPGNDSSLGSFADATIGIPLLRGSSTFVVTEPLKQAEREVIYAIYGFERFKRVFAVQIATDYYGVMQLRHEVDNELENYRYLIEATRRARRMAEAQRLDAIQVDQTEQDELKARDTWVQAIRAYEQKLDQFKQSLGLPVDARIELDMKEFDMLVDVSRFATRPAERQRVPADAPVVITPPSRIGGGPFEVAPETAVIVALKNRLDLRIAIGRILDGQRHVAVDADRLRADLTLLGSGSIGERRTISDASLPNGQLRASEARYSVLGVLNLPLERTAERNVFRNSEIEFERSVRAAQQFEDQVKFEVREDLRVLLEARERLQIQDQSLQLARRRVDVTSRLLQVGRASARDVLEAQTDLTDSKNAFSLERVRYRLAELALQRDLDLLQVNEQGLWKELDPKSLTEGG